MQALFQAPLSSAALTKATGLKGGNLHHHLKELIYSSYVRAEEREQERRYILTNLGIHLLMTFAMLAGKIIQDRGDDLVTVDIW